MENMVRALNEAQTDKKEILMKYLSKLAIIVLMLSFAAQIAYACHGMMNDPCLRKPGVGDALKRTA